MSWVAVGAAAVTGGIKVAQGIKQKKAAKNIKAIAPEVGTQAVDMQKNIASRSKVPGQDAMTEQIDAGTSNLLQQGTNMGQPGALSSLIGQAMSNQQNYKQKIGADASKYRADQEAKTVSAVQGQEDKKFALDKENYTNALGAIQGLNAAGDANIAGALDSASAAAISAGGSGKKDKKGKSGE